MVGRSRLSPLAIALVLALGAPLACTPKGAPASAARDGSLDGATTTVAAPSPDGRIQITRRPFDPAAPTASPRPERRERYWNPTVLLRGSIAVVWAPYEFWRDGKTTHCGVDVFDLVKQDDVWRVANIMYTVEPQACPELRPKDASQVRPSP